MSDLDLKTVSWQDVQAQVEQLNPEFAELVNELSPDASFKLYLAKYPFGARILSGGKFFLPTLGGDTVPFASDLVPKDIREDLDYNLSANPVTLVLKNSLEMFVTLEDRIVPFSMAQPGRLFGLWRWLDVLGGADSQEEFFSHTSIFVWDMTAGARSSFMLPKVSEALAHNKLKQNMRIKADKPSSLLDHWEVFKDLAVQENFPEPWNVEVLFFSKKWVESLRDAAWLKLRCFLLNMVWQGTSFWRNQFVWNLTFTRIQALRKIKASSYIADVVKHLLGIGIGVFPGFRPALDSSFAPISGIQKMYLEHYELKDYSPIIMQPSFFDFSAKQEAPIYYSLQFPTAGELTPKTSGRSSAISDLYDLRSLLNKYIESIIDGGLNIESTPLHELSKCIQLDYYHNNVELYDGMRDSDSLAEYDLNFKKAMDVYPGREFPKNSAFLKGLVAISCKEDEVE